MAFGRAIAAAYKRHGSNPAKALTLAQIAPAQLANRDGRMTARQMEILSAAAMRELDDEGLGAFSRKLPWGSYGMLARASLTAPDLGTALKRWCRHHGLLVPDIALSLTLSEDIASIGIEERVALPSPARELCLAFILRNVHGLACWYVDSRVPLREAGLPFAEPRHAGAYAHMFPGAPVRFGAAQAHIRFDARYLALPLRRDETALNRMLRQQALNIPVLPYRRDRLLVEQVRQALLLHPGKTTGADGLSALLHLSTRTLHRQLKLEGATLQQLKDEVRHERAKDLLLRGGKPIKQIAAEVGFRNEKSFIRAFRAWTGASPGEFRRRA